MINVTSKEHFEELLQNDSTISIVDFWAEWCGPCKKMSPHLNALSDSLENGSAQVLKVNIEEVSELAQEYRIQSIPTVLFLKGEEVIEKTIGLKSKDDLLEVYETLEE